jgi:hypothetical protein
MSTKLMLIERSDDYETLEVWQREHRESQKLDNRGFADDLDVPVLGLEEMEDELLMSEARKYDHSRDRHRYRGIPLSSATAAEARQAREADIDDMTRREWDDES